MRGLLCSAPARYDIRRVDSTWRHLDLGRCRLVIKARLRRVDCPDHGVRTEQVPFARVESGFTRDFEDLVAWLATRMDKTAVRRLTRIAWRRSGRSASGWWPTGSTRPARPAVRGRRRRSLLAQAAPLPHLVTDHRTGKVVWGSQGKDTATLDRFFADLGEQRSAQLTAVSADMGPAFLKSVTTKAPNATVCIDPFHVVKLATDALDQVRRQVWNQLRKVDPARAKTFKGARWVLLKRPERLSNTQAATLRKLRRHGGAAWRADGLKEALRAVFASDLANSKAAELLDRWCAKASRSRLAPFVTLAATIRKHRQASSPRSGWGQQRAGRGAEQQGAAHHPPRLRVPLRRGHTRAGDARLRPHHPPPPI